MARQKSPAELRAINDPIERAKALAVVSREAETLVSELRQVRDETITDLRALGWGYDRIAAVTGMTKARVQQVVKQPPDT